MNGAFSSLPSWAEPPRQGSPLCRTGPRLPHCPRLSSHLLDTPLSEDKPQKNWHIWQCWRCCVRVLWCEPACMHVHMISRTCLDAMTHAKRGRFWHPVAYLKTAVWLTSCRMTVSPLYPVLLCCCILGFSVADPACPLTCSGFSTGSLGSR